MNERVECPECGFNHNATNPGYAYGIYEFWRVFCVCGTPLEYTGQARVVWIIEEW